LLIIFFLFPGIRFEVSPWKFCTQYIVRRRVEGNFGLIREKESDVISSVLQALAVLCKFIHYL